MQCKSNGNMEDLVTENVCSTPPFIVETQESHDVKTTESAENFQKFMYDLFEKNGVINDLRAYLRGHIVGILRSARTGDPPPCQKHFTQRLELPYQALNMLLAEYLLRLEFSYTLSVFISEIPLANMVLDFARSLMQGNHSSEMRFKDEDVWSILNYLGVKCDSEHASNIVEMYRENIQSPLLLCMLKGMPLYTPLGLDKGTVSSSSVESVSSSVKIDTPEACSRRASSRCKHLSFCNTCRGNMLREKEKYKTKRKTLAKNMTESSVKPQSVESLMKNVDVIERKLIDQMFQQLKSVYEAEMQMAKTEEEERVKRSLAAHAVQLRRKRIEMEEKFKSRELELSRNVQQKKRFLWGLARLLRDQHQQMARAMRDVQAETDRLAAKEDSLKSQLAEAGASLRARGEDMRRQISAELAVLEGRLDSLRRERGSIQHERSELEHMQRLCDKAKTTDVETSKEDIRSHYDQLKNEFNILKKYLETAKLESKCVVERGTITDDSTRIDAVLNNEHVDSSRSEDRVKAKHLVNDLKKMKNVNFSQSNVAEIYRSSSSEAGDARHVTRLMEENERLRTFATQQREYIDELSSQQAGLRAALTAARATHAPHDVRPRTAPSYALLDRMSGQGSWHQVSGHGWGKGAGEEHSFVAHAHPATLVPGDTLPLTGVTRDPHDDNTRYLINQWRSLRRRTSPVGEVGKSGPKTGAGASASRDCDTERPNSAGPSVRLSYQEDLNINENQEVALGHSYKYSRDQNEQRPKSSENSVKIGGKNLKSMPREAKDRLKSGAPVRERSPAGVVRDAKRRLRILEIEAEAVENSYLRYKQKQDALRHAPADDVHSPGTRTDSKRERVSFKSDESRIERSRYIPSREPAIEQIIEDIDEYRAKYDIGVTHFKNNNATAMKVRPIPASPCGTPLDTKRNQNYLETSMAEFRRYYHSEKRATNETFIKERPGSSQSRNRNIQSPAPISTFVSPKLADEDGHTLSVARNRRDSENSSHNEETIERNEPYSPKDRNDNSNDNVDTRSPRIKKNTIAENELNTQRTETKQKTEQEKSKELEILKRNITKIYDLPEKTMAENNENYNEAVENAKREMENERKGIIEESIPEASRYESISESGTKGTTEDRNLLRIEVQSVSQVNDVKITESETQDLLLVVESSNAVERSDVDVQREILSTQITILVSPRSNSRKYEEIDLESPPGSIHPGEKSVLLSEHDVLNSLYEAEANANISSDQEMQIDTSRDVFVPFLTDTEINNADNQDDLSADVDANSLRDDTDHDGSPISMAKTSEDENFWDS